MFLRRSLLQRMEFIWRRRVLEVVSMKYLQLYRDFLKKFEKWGASFLRRVKRRLFIWLHHKKWNLYCHFEIHKPRSNLSMIILDVQLGQFKVCSKESVEKIATCASLPKTVCEVQSTSEKIHCGGNLDGQYMCKGVSEEVDFKCCNYDCSTWSKLARLKLYIGEIRLCQDTIYRFQCI